MYFLHQRHSLHSRQSYYIPQPRTDLTRNSFCWSNWSTLFCQIAPDSHSNFNMSSILSLSLSLSFLALSPLLTLACNKDAQISSIHECQLFDGLRRGFWETLEPEHLHHPEIITLEEPQEIASPKCS